MKHTKYLAVIALLVLVLFFLPPSTATPEPPAIEWQKNYGFQATSVIQTSDGGYVLSGASGATIVKTDSSGTILWQKTFGFAVSVAQTKDLGYAVFCQNGSVVQMDSDGSVLFSFSVGVNRNIRQGIVTEDGEFIAVGNNARTDLENYVWLRKFDAQGTILWDMNYTGGFQISSVISTVDHGCALAGNWKNNFWLAKLDSNGNQQWSQNYAYGDPLDAHYVYSIDRTSDGGFILSGSGRWQASNGMIPWLIKINAQGYEQWNLPYSQYGNDSFAGITQTNGNGYLVARPKAATVMRADSSGSEVWQEPLASSGVVSLLGAPSVYVISTRDGGHLIAGSTSGGAFMMKLSAEANSQSATVKIASPQSQAYDTGDIPLTFIVNNQDFVFSYALDGQQAIEINENTTLSKLTVGPHNITVYATDSAGLVAASETVSFSVEAHFPWEIIFAGLTVAIIAGVSLLFYFRRPYFAVFTKKGLKSLASKRTLTTIGQNKLAWTLIIISLCFLLVFIEIFSPYVLYSSVSKHPNGSFEVGVSYVYERDSIERIYNEVAHIKDLGISLIRVNLVCDSSIAAASLNALTDVFYSAVRQLDVKVALIINNHQSTSDINYYLTRWGGDVTYIQILNEPDVASSWEMGALFTDDEAGSKFQDIYETVAQHQLSAKLYTNFTPAFIARTSLPIQFSEKLDFVGYDVFMDSFLTISPNMIQLLHKITNKDVVITEFGMSTGSDATQSDYIIRGLDLFKNMGLKGCWIVYWNGADNDYGIRGRLTEQKIGEWIAQNA